jgi:hypothetical protein
MTSTTSSSRGPRVRAAAAATILLATLLAGCSASGGSSDSADGSGSVAQAPEPASDGGNEVAGEGADDSAQDAEARQVIQTGTVAVTATDPRAVADQVVTFVEAAGGRVDDRSEHAARDDGSSSAALTVRVPAAKVTATVDRLRELGKVDSVDLKGEDVTGTAKDLDARISALKVSVARLEDLMAHATSTKDLLDAESTLSERQASLEQLESQRAQLADQVALSTLTITLDPPGAVPAADDNPRSFWDGLQVGWESLVATVKGIVVVLAVLLPWLAFAGAIAALVVATVRWRRRTRPGEHPTRGAHPVAMAPAGVAGPSGPTPPVGPSPAAAPPSAPPAGPDGAPPPLDPNPEP